MLCAAGKSGPIVVPLLLAARRALLRRRGRSLEAQLGGALRLLGAEALDELGEASLLADDRPHRLAVARQVRQRLLVPGRAVEEFQRLNHLRLGEVQPREADL